MSTTTTILPPPVQQKFSAKLLSVPQANLIHKTFAMPKVIEENMGDILRMRRYTRLETAPVPVNPAMLNPPSQQLQAVDIDAQIDWYGTYVVITKQVTLINEDPVLNEAAARLGQSLRETEDQLIRDMLEATATFLNAVNGTNGDNPTEITRVDVDAVIATLYGNDAEFVDSIVEGTNKFGTAPLRESFFAMGHTDLIGDLENVAGFVNKAQYPSQDGTLRAEWGSIGNARYLLSSRGSSTVGASLLGADVYNIFYTGQEAYCCVELNGATAKFIYHPPGWGDDPIELRQTAGYRMAQVPRITNDAWIINQRVTLG